MTMKLSQEFESARKAFADAVASGAEMDVQNQLYNDMLEAMFAEARKQARTETEEIIESIQGYGKISAKEIKYFNELKKGAPDGLDEFLPEETIDRIFENLKKDHPLLEHIGLRSAAFRLKFYEGETEGKAVWGALYDDIKGQLTQKFSKSTSISHKLTAFVVLPKDVHLFGPSWLMSFVTIQIQEAFAAALEEAFLNGDGNNKPIGLSRTLSGRTENEATTYDKKAASGILTFADPKVTVKEFTQIHKHHSIDSKGNKVNVDGQIVMVVNPADAWDVKKQYTHLNANGVFVTALPYNVILIESIYQTAKEVTTFVKGRYMATIAGGFEFRKYDQTFALEDLDVYIAKQFAYGKARDEKTAAVWTLQVPDAIPGA
ncbi:TPA: phage major capsid protein [Streptococcus suis]